MKGYDDLLESTILYRSLTEQLSMARRGLYIAIREARKTNSLAAIAKLTGLSKQRIVQIERMK